MFDNEVQPLRLIAWHLALEGIRDPLKMLAVAHDRGWVQLTDDSIGVEVTPAGRAVAEEWAAGQEEEPDAS